MALFTNDQEEYDFQNTDLGRQVLEMKKQMKQEYVHQLHIPNEKIKVGELIQFNNVQTGEVRYYKKG